ncbi:MAG: amidohydrolase family protein [Chloroflexota bacterium]
MIIDFHTHIVPPWLKERRSDYLGQDPCFDLLYSQPKAKLATAEELIASMDGAGVDVSVALNIGWVSHQLCVSTNDYILNSVARYPKRLVGFCTIQPGAGEAALRELERCVQGGARGVGELRPDIQRFDISDLGLMEILASTVKQHRLIVLTHSSEPVGHRYPGKGKVTPEVLERLVPVFQGTNVVCAHWGGGLPFYWLMPEVAQAFQNVFFDTAATRFLYSPSIYCRVAELVGPDRILMGSDYPLIAQNRQIQEIRSLDSPEELKERVLGANAQRLLFPA